MRGWRNHGAMLKGRTTQLYFHFVLPIDALHVVYTKGLGLI